jgi:hypothetical protein
MKNSKMDSKNQKSDKSNHPTQGSKKKMNQHTDSKTKTKK